MPQQDANFASTRVHFVHTLPQLVGVFSELADTYLPGAQVTHVVDADFYSAEFEHGRLNQSQQKRLIGYLNDGGAGPDSFSVVTCSFLGTYVDRLAGSAVTEWVRIDEAMARKALSVGSRIGILATGKAPIESTTMLLNRLSEELGQPITLRSCAIEEAYAALVEGDAERHNSLIVEQVRQLENHDVEVIIFSQASMARALTGLNEAPSVPVLTSPDFCMQNLRDRVTSGAN